MCSLIRTTIKMHCFFVVKNIFFIYLTLHKFYMYDMKQNIFGSFGNEINFLKSMNECKEMDETISLASPYITCRVALIRQCCTAILSMYREMVFSSTISRQRVRGRI